MKRCQLQEKISKVPCLDKVQIQNITGMLWKEYKTYKNIKKLNDKIDKLMKRNLQLIDTSNNNLNHTVILLRINDLRNDELNEIFKQCTLKQKQKMIMSTMVYNSKLHSQIPNKLYEKYYLHKCLTLDIFYEILKFLAISEIHAVFSRINKSFSCFIKKTKHSRKYNYKLKLNKSVIDAIKLAQLNINLLTNIKLLECNICFEEHQYKWEYKIMHQIIEKRDKVCYYC